MDRSNFCVDKWLAEKGYHQNDIKLGLDRIKSVGEKADLFTFPCSVITVGGTNGKGSTVAILANLLQAANLNVGTYTSPHLLQFNERIQINGKLVSDEVIQAALLAIDDLREETPLTYFEFTTLAAFYIFKHHTPKLDAIILEVGMGGRLDAVNTVSPNIAVITSIHYDHQQFLGETLEEIAKEKAGIFRPNIPVVLGETVLASVALQAKEAGCSVLREGQDFYLESPILDAANKLRQVGKEGAANKSRQVGKEGAANKSWQVGKEGAANKLRQVGEEGAIAFQENDCQVWAYKNKKILLPSTKLPKHSLSIALAVYHILAENFLSLPDIGNITHVLANKTMVARLQRCYYRGIELILDAGHNAQASQWLVDKLNHGSRSYRAIWASLSDKKCQDIVRPLIDKINVWHVPNVNSARSVPAEALLAILNEQGAKCAKAHGNVKEALDCALSERKPRESIIVFGSFYLVSEILSMIDFKRSYLENNGLYTEESEQ